MSTNLEVKEIDTLEKLYLFLERFDCWWISDVSYDLGTDSCMIFEKQDLKCISVKELLENK